MFITALFTVAKTRKRPVCPAIEGWIEMWDIYTMEYYSATRKDEVMTFAATGLDLGNIMLHGISQTEKAKNHTISLIHGI